MQMPFKSEAQRKFMFARHPEIAKRWVAEGKGNVVDNSPKPGATVAENGPVGKAGQPPFASGNSMGKGKKKRTPAQQQAIQQRLAAMRKGKK